MKFYNKLYISDGLEKKKEKWIKKLKSGKWPLQAYILVLPDNVQNQLEFYSAAMLYQKYFYSDDIFIVGLAESYMEAIYLVEEIAREVFEKTGDADLRLYLLQQQQLYEENNKTEV